MQICIHVCVCLHPFASLPQDRPCYWQPKTCIYVCVYICIYVCVCYWQPNICIYVCVYIHTYIHTYIHIYIYSCIDICVCFFLECMYANYERKERKI